MSKVVMVYQVNGTGKPKMPVREWVVKPIPLYQKVAGLLEYGYSREQIKAEIGIPMRELKSLMRHYGFKTIDKFPIKWKQI